MSFKERRLMGNLKFNPYIVLAIGVIAVSTSAIFVKVSTAPSGVIAFYRLLFSVLLMLPIFITKYRAELKLITKRDWGLTTVSGIFLALHFILWFESLNYTSVASSTVLVTLQPIFAFAGTYFFFKERLSLKAIFSGLIAVMGSVIISWGDFKVSGSAFFGDVLALTACALITFYLLFGQSVRKRVSLITYTFLVYSISTFFLFLYILVTGEALYPYPKKDWVYFISLAIIPTLLGHTLINWVVKWVSTSMISVAILFEPVGATVLAYYVIGETVNPSQVIGGLVVLLGIGLFIYDERKVTRKLLKTKPT
jgi:drug/metabolite transporter (DMT)-like permease